MGRSSFMPSMSSARGTTADPLAALVRAVVAEVGDLRTRVERLEGGRGRRPDPAQDERLISAIAVTFGGRVLTAADLVRRAERNRELAAVLDARHKRQVGAWLKRLRDCEIAGYVLRRVSRDAGGTLWELRVSPHRHTGQ